jgi:hypothetical protein
MLSVASFFSNRLHSFFFVAVLMLGVIANCTAKIHTGYDHSFLDFPGFFFLEKARAISLLSIIHNFSLTKMLLKKNSVSICSTQFSNNLPQLGTKELCVGFYLL